MSPHTWQIKLILILLFTSLFIVKLRLCFPQGRPQGRELLWNHDGETLDLLKFSILSVHLRPCSLKNLMCADRQKPAAQNLRKGRVWWCDVTLAVQTLADAASINQA